MSAGKFSFFGLIILLYVLSSVLLLPVFALSTRESALSSISDAEESTKKAYEAVLDAERCGANVSALLATLSGGAGLLSNASTALEAGNFDEAVSSAALSSQVGGDVRIEAERLQVEVCAANVTRSGWYLVGSVVGVSAVVGFSFLGYRFFKRAHFRRLLKMKPRVEQV